MLKYRIELPEAPRDGAPLVVLLHGRGADESDLLGLSPYLPDDVILVTPRAPFSGAPWGYGPGWAWYRYIEEDRPDEDSFEQGQEELDAFLEALPGELPVRPGPLVLGGFSQGGTMSLARALRRPGTVPLAVVFSGFLARHPAVEVTPRTVADTAIFWGHGTQDQAIPHSLAERGRATLRGAGADLEAHDYAIGHWIEGGEMTDAVVWLHDRLDRLAE